MEDQKNSPDTMASSMRRRVFRPWLVITAILAATVYQLRAQGRLWWCACGQGRLWDGDIWSAHNSQHLVDPYSFTHILHGILLGWLVAWAMRRAPVIWKVAAVVGAEALWEVIENSRFVIQRYREATIGIGYEGDSIVNSLGDLLCCATGFFLARYLGFWRSLALFVVVELVLLFWVRDNLTLNVLMLIHPIEAVKTWQMVH